MPQKHAALKQIRKDRKRRERNLAMRSELRHVTKRFLTLLNAKQVDEARALIHDVVKQYDRAASQGVIHRNTAARYKSRLTRRVNRQSSSPSASASSS